MFAIHCEHPLPPPPLSPLAALERLTSSEEANSGKVKLALAGSPPEGGARNAAHASEELLQPTTTASYRERGLTPGVSYKAQRFKVSKGLGVGVSYKLVKLSPPPLKLVELGAVANRALGHKAQHDVLACRRPRA